VYSISLYETILDTMPNGVFTLDVQCRIKIWNRMMEKLTGYEASEVIGKHYSFLKCGGHESRQDRSEFPDGHKAGRSRSEARAGHESRPGRSEFPGGHKAGRSRSEARAGHDSGGNHSESTGGRESGGARNEDPECALLNKDMEFIEQQECAIMAKSGERIPVLKNARVLKDQNNHPLGIVVTVTDIRLIKQLESEMSLLLQPGIAGRGLGKLIGRSHAMQEVFERIRLAGNSEAAVLIEGETGTGKELVAEAIHQESERRDKPLVKLNCSALSEGLLESELFGHVKGAFTGATRDKIGRFEFAHKGTIFLDEIGDISPLIQLKLLRVLQEKEIERVGESVTRKVNVRVIAATHRNLRKMVAEGQFRQDLYYRLRVFSISVPPLRQRKEDIPLLVESFINRLNATTKKNLLGVSSDVYRCFMDYCWPGNVRELENAIEHGFVTCQEKELGIFDLPLEIRRVELRKAECLRSGTQDRVYAPQEPYAADTPEHLIAVLKACRWNKSEAARKLGLERTTVWRKMKQWGIPLTPPNGSHPPILLDENPGTLSDENLAVSSDENPIPDEDPAILPD